MKHPLQSAVMEKFYQTSSPGKKCMSSMVV
jgi:hypothetical protein